MSTQTPKPVSAIVGTMQLKNQRVLHASIILVGGKTSSIGAVARKLARRHGLTRVLTTPDFNRHPPKFDYVICVDDIHKAPPNYKALLRITFKDAVAMVGT